MARKNRFPGKNKIRLLSLLKKIYPEESSQKLYSAVLCGEIYVNGEKIRFPEELIKRGSSVEWKKNRYVGRGGYKLEGALDSFGINPEKQVWLDAGASTGGFTDCLLSKGALAVHTVDVGYNQLAWKLRTDKRVIVHERTNIMEVEKDTLVPSPSFAVADLSFRSLRGAASKILSLLVPSPDAVLLALVKPQFENPDEENFDGVVKSESVIRNVLELLAADMEHEGVYIENAALSVIAGRKGNSEIFLLLSADPERKPPDIAEKFDSVMEEIRRRQESAKLSLPSGLPTGKPSPPR